MGRKEISEDAIPIAVEDRFIIFSFGTGRSLCPSGTDGAHLGAILSSIENLVPIFDLRKLDDYFNDVDTFIKNVAGNDSYVILGRTERRKFDDGLLFDDSLLFDTRLPTSFRVIQANGNAYKTSLLRSELFAEQSIERFRDEAENILQKKASRSTTPKLYRSFRAREQQAFDLQCDSIRRFLASCHRNSLLIEFVMAANGDKLMLCPYHGHAVHQVETKPESVLVGRPAVIARNTRAVFSREIAALEELINGTATKERHIQTFLEANPNILRGLNYENIYPQLVLEREGDGPLIPDFILEPLDDGFCDILDIKLPKQTLFVGGKDRAQLAAGLHVVAAQLREYAAYFEQTKYRKFVREKYGLRVYRPRLIAVVGRDMKRMTDEQFRRAITAYDNLQFLTFDELVQHAKNRLLV